MQVNKFIFQYPASLESHIDSTANFWETITLPYLDEMINDHMRLILTQTENAETAPGLQRALSALSDRISKEPKFNTTEGRDLAFRVCCIAMGIYPSNGQKFDLANLPAEILRLILSKITPGNVEIPVERYFKEIKLVSNQWDLKANEAEQSWFIELFQTTFNKIVPIENVKNASAQIINTFGTCRNPSAIFSYAAGLKKLDDKSVMDCLAKFVKGVLEGTFVSDRHSHDNNPHLKRLSEIAPDILSKWYISQSFPLKELVGESLLESQTQSDNSETEIVVDSEDPFDLLLCGTDVPLSSLTVFGSPEFNKGLLGYLMDGKNRLIAVKNPQGKILSRSILRILLDGEKVVLFMEHCTPYGSSEKHEQAIRKVAQKKAYMLGVSLVEMRGQGAQYGSTLQSLGSPSPFEYVNGAGGMQAQGIYTIQNCTLA